MKTPGFFAAMLSLTLTVGVMAAPATLHLPNGQVYQEAEITGWDDAYVTIRHSTGIASVRISELPLEQRKALGYDPMKAARQMAAERKALAAKEEQESLLKERRKLERRKVFIFGVVTEMRSHGYATMNATRYGDAEERYKKLEPSELGKDWKLKQKEVTRTVRREIRMEGVQVIGVPPNLPVGATWQGEVWPAGEQPIRNASGAITSMAPRYATSPDLAASLIEEERQAAAKAALEKKKK